MTNQLAGTRSRLSVTTSPSLGSVEDTGEKHSQAR